MADIEPLSLQPVAELNGTEKLVNSDRTPSFYFLEYLRQRGGFFSAIEAYVLSLIQQLNTLSVSAGGALSGGGLIINNPTISLDALSPDPSGSFTNSDITVDEYGRVTAASTGSSGDSWAIKTSDYTASAGDALMVDTTGGPITIILPASPSVNGTVKIADYASNFGTNAVTVDGNSEKIVGLTFDAYLAADGANTVLVYSGLSQGWIATGFGASLITLVDFTTWNPSDKAAGITLSDSNRLMTGTAGHAGVRGTTGKSSGKWYFEFNAVSAGSNDLHIGIADTTTAGVSLSYVGANANQFGLSCNGTRNDNGAGVNSGTPLSFTNGDVIGIALDCTAGQVDWYKNGTLMCSRTGLAALTFYPMGSSANTLYSGRIGTIAAQFAYSPPSGYSEWG